MHSQITDEYKIGKMKKNTEAKVPTDLIEIFEEQGDQHLFTSVDTPMHSQAFALSPEEKIAKIASSFADIMTTLGLDLNDDSLKGTPYRVAKMYVEEVFSGLLPENKPEAKLFANKYNYKEMLVERDITLKSFCEHHFVPIIGRAHVAYISTGKVIGLSKINRIVSYFAKRPQVQERLTEQIATELKKVLQTNDVAVVLDAKHMCVSLRGIEDNTSSTLTSHYSGCFSEERYRTEFLKYISFND